MVKTIAIWILLTWIIENGKKRILIFGNMWDEVGIPSIYGGTELKCRKTFYGIIFCRVSESFERYFRSHTQISRWKEGLIFYFSKNMGTWKRGARLWTWKLTTKAKIYGLVRVFFSSWKYEGFRLYML